MQFTTPLVLTGPHRRPTQMLGSQVYDGHLSVHDAQEAARLGLAGAPIEGPTHLSQLDPLAVALWGRAWFERGRVSVHFQNMVVEGEQVWAQLERPEADSEAALVRAFKADGTPVLRGSASVGAHEGPSECSERLARTRRPEGLQIVDRLETGPVGSPVEVRMTTSEPNGDLYPFSLADKVARMTEPHPWYGAQASTPWGGPIIPLEMVSVLAHRVPVDLPVRTPSIGLFLDLEIEVTDGPLLVDHAYVLHREVVALSESRRTESYWLRSTITDAASERTVARVLLHSGVFKDSYPGYEATTA